MEIGNRFFSPEVYHVLSDKTSRRKKKKLLNLSSTCFQDDT